MKNNNGRQVESLKMKESNGTEVEYLKKQQWTTSIKSENKLIATDLKLQL